MPDIKNMKVGQRLWTVRRERMGNTTMKRTAIHDVVVKEIDPQFRWIIASWNGNPAQKYFPRAIRRWKVRNPRKKLEAACAAVSARLHPDLLGSDGQPKPVKGIKYLGTWGTP